MAEPIIQGFPNAAYGKSTSFSKISLGIQDCQLIEAGNISIPCKGCYRDVLDLSQIHNQAITGKQTPLLTPTDKNGMLSSFLYSVIKW